MILVLADRRDTAAAMLVNRWREHDAHLITPADISAPGWTHCVGDPTATTAAVDGVVIPADRIAGVLVRVPCVTADALTHIAAEDRAYAAAEMTAFLAAWLTELSCPVINRPCEAGLAGPPWPAHRWVMLAARLGIPVRPVRQQVMPGGGNGAPAVSAPDASNVVIIGERCVGPANPVQSDYSRKLAAAAGCAALLVQFDGAEDDSRLIGAGWWVDVGDTDVADALAALMGVGGRQ